MLCSKMSGNRSPLRKSLDGRSHNSSGSSIVSFHGTWAQEIGNDEQDKSSHSINNSVEMQSRSCQEEEMKSMEHSSSQDREISLEFIDGANEEKFERLVKEDKIKTPFKRRHSQTPSSGSRSNSPNDSNSDNAATEDKSRKEFQHTNNWNKNQYEAQKRQRYNSHGSSTSSKSKEREHDPAVLARRQKQIEYGKNTVAYERYIDLVPIRKRTRNHPRTPDKYGKYSRRTFDGLIKVWRKQLHYYDPEPAAGTANNGDDDDDSD
ncbi:histone RNA hairpin-binding protein [Ceratitis capitata]|uniref:(Mediterranean fruit fly) hypothetical protein n=1 Tax=Ceratitis capitata TaxID=7213 RepID=W8C5V3_CERCA|nr:histone RNA hairpin-binding protein [Ceratitis capitata]CAD6993731.1 unnamed protein product [Ceratitis capitata]